MSISTRQMNKAADFELSSLMSKQWWQMCLFDWLARPRKRGSQISHILENIWKKVHLKTFWTSISKTKSVYPFFIKNAIYLFSKVFRISWCVLGGNVSLNKVIYLYISRVLLAGNENYVTMLVLTVWAGIQRQNYETKAIRVFASGQGDTKSCWLYISICMVCGVPGRMYICHREIQVQMKMHRKNHNTRSQTTQTCYPWETYREQTYKNE